jgi:hypothetical protein
VRSLPPGKPLTGPARPGAATANAQASTVTVLLNDGHWPSLAAPALVVNDVSVTEGNTGTTAGARGVRCNQMPLTKHAECVTLPTCYPVEKES